MPRDPREDRLDKQVLIISTTLYVYTVHTGKCRRTRATERVCQSYRALRAAQLHAGEGGCALLCDCNVVENAGSIGHDDACGEALDVMREVRSGAAVAAVSGRITAVLLICGTASVKLNEAL